MLEVRREHRVAILRLNRPERRNAIGAEMVEALQSALARCDRDPMIGAIVLEAAPPGFCAGSDLKELAGMDIDAMCRHEAATAALVRSIPLLGKPVIAAVEGFALGGGFILAACCDVVVTDPATRWHLPEVSLGWVPPWGLQTLIVRVGPTTARRLAWGAEPIDGVEAHRLGIADRLADADASASAAAAAEARRLAALPAEAVAATKRSFVFSINHDAEAMDALANCRFAENCRLPAAAASLRRFGVKA